MIEVPGKVLQRMEEAHRTTGASPGTGVVRWRAAAGVLLDWVAKEPEAMAALLHAHVARHGWGIQPETTTERLERALEELAQMEERGTRPLDVATFIRRAVLGTGEPA